MIDDQAREDLAFIREAIEEGRVYATSCGQGMVVWGIAVAAGFVATYGFVRGWSPLTPAVLWPIAMAIGWAVTLGLLWRAAVAGLPSGPIVAALRMLWVGLGVFLTPLALAALWSGEVRLGWLNAVGAGMMGLTMFATASLVALPWVRWVALGWWVGELALFELRYRPEALLISAALSLLLLAGPGLVLVARQRKFAA